MFINEVLLSEDSFWWVLPDGREEHRGEQLRKWCGKLPGVNWESVANLLEIMLFKSKVKTPSLIPSYILFEMVNSL